MLGTQLQTTGDALDLRKREKLMEEYDPYFKPNYSGQENQSSNNNRPGQSQRNRGRGQGQVRRVHHGRPEHYDSGYEPPQRRNDSPPHCSDRGSGRDGLSRGYGHPNSEN
jgi:hypothetical protein